MKKGRILRLMFILAVTTIMIAATAVVASAATVNKMMQIISIPRHTTTV